MTLSEKLKDFDFSDGKRYIFTKKYDIQNENDRHVRTLDDDADDAASCVNELGLSYDVNSRHYSTVIDGDHITDMVEVTWEFWRV